jgi:hypothetical protein
MNQDHRGLDLSWYCFDGYAEIAEDAAQESPGVLCDLRGCRPTCDITAR